MPSSPVFALFIGGATFRPISQFAQATVHFTGGATFAPIAGKSADLNWPNTVFIPRTPQVVLSGTTVGGGRSLTGKIQEVAADSGFWLITLGNIPIRTNSEILQWRELEGELEGRLNTILVPFFDSKRAPWPGGVVDATITASMSGAVAQGATSGSINMSVGAAPQAGMFFSAGERGYRLKSVGSPTGSIYPVTWLPPLRESIADAFPLEFAHPVCRCRLRSDDGMALPLDLMKFAVKSVEFEEDV